MALVSSNYSVLSEQPFELPRSAAPQAEGTRAIVRDVQQLVASFRKASAASAAVRADKGLSPAGQAAAVAPITAALQKQIDAFDVAKLRGTATTGLAALRAKALPTVGDSPADLWRAGRELDRLHAMPDGELARRVVNRDADTLRLIAAAGPLERSELAGRVSALDECKLDVLLGEAARQANPALAAEADAVEHSLRWAARQLGTVRGLVAEGLDESASIRPGSTTANYIRLAMNDCLGGGADESVVVVDPVAPAEAPDQGASA